MDNNEFIGTMAEMCQMTNGIIARIKDDAFQATVELNNIKHMLMKYIIRENKLYELRDFERLGVEQIFDIFEKFIIYPYGCLVKKSKSFSTSHGHEYAFVFHTKEEAYKVERNNIKSIWVRKFIDSPDVDSEMIEIFSNNI